MKPHYVSVVLNSKHGKMDQALWLGPFFEHHTPTKDYVFKVGNKLCMGIFYS